MIARGHTVMGRGGDVCCTSCKVTAGIEFQGQSVVDQTDDMSSERN